MEDEEVGPLNGVLWEQRRAIWRNVQDPARMPRQGVPRITSRIPMPVTADRLAVFKTASVRANTRAENNFHESIKIFILHLRYGLPVLGKVHGRPITERSRSHEWNQYR